MKKEMLGGIVLLLCLLPFVSAGETDVENLLKIKLEDGTEDQQIEIQKQILLENLDSIAAVINTKLEKMPGLVQSILGSTRVNVYLEQQKTMGIVFKDGEIIEILPHAVEDQNFNVYISDELFRTVNNEGFDFKYAVETGMIHYEGVGFIGKMKSRFVSAALKFSG